MILTLALGVLTFILIALAFSWLGWRVLQRWGLRALAAFALAASLLYASVGTFRLASNQAALGISPRPGSLPANFIQFSLLAGACFLGAGIGLWRHSRAPAGVPQRPLRAGVIGFFAGLAVPLTYAFAQDLRRLLGG